MSDFYYEYTGKARQAELIEQARADALINTLPHHPSPLARLWGRISSRVRRPRVTHTVTHPVPAGTARHA